MKYSKSGNDSYTGMDYVRVVAAFLVIAIHTSPLTTYSETGDFILTRIVARMAVPFFLMVSGFFLITRYAHEVEKLKSYLRKMAVLYGVSIVFYLPVNIYGHYFSMDHLLPNMIKDLVFDGTMYHLWYFPASMLGVVIAWLLVRKWGYQKAFGITVFLYMCGLFGDSYYGFVKEIPLLAKLYEQLFEVSDYTRNGLFFTPVFFVMGGMIRERVLGRSKETLPGCLAGFGISFLLLFGEGMLLHLFQMQRHDSMYFFLLPCMYFLFRALTFWRGGRKPLLRTVSLVIFCIHPMVIVAVRLLAKLTGQQAVLVENSLIHYLAVSVVSGGCAVLGVWLYEKMRAGRPVPFVRGTDRAWIEVDQNNLRHNVRELRKAMPGGCRLMAVVKAEGYGHGMCQVAACLGRMGVRDFAVATIEEGIKLRRDGIQGEILILGYTHPGRAKELRRYDLTQTLADYDHAVSLDRQGCDVKVHVGIDTGMHRLGLDARDVEKVLRVWGRKHLKIKGIYTHLCAADSDREEDIAFTRMQIDRFYKLLEELKKEGIGLPPIHIQSSYGLLNYPELHCDYVRAGIALYGCLSSAKDRTKLQLDLRPVLSLRTRVVSVKQVKKGESVGYGRAFVADTDSRIAILSVGYGDGVPRSLSNGKGEVLIDGWRAPIVGRICMDQMAVDVTKLPVVKVGMTATLIGSDKTETIRAEEVAGEASGIANELLCRMGERVRTV